MDCFKRWTAWDGTDKGIDHETGLGDLFLFNVDMTRPKSSLQGSRLCPIYVKYLGIHKDLKMIRLAMWGSNCWAIRPDVQMVLGSCILQTSHVKIWIDLHDSFIESLWAQVNTQSVPHLFPHCVTTFSIHSMKPHYPKCLNEVVIRFGMDHRIAEHRHIVVEWISGFTEPDMGTEAIDTSSTDRELPENWMGISHIEKPRMEGRLVTRNLLLRINAEPHRSRPSAFNCTAFKSPLHHRRCFKAQCWLFTSLLWKGKYNRLSKTLQQSKK